MGRRKRSWTEPVNSLERARFQLRIDRIKAIPFLDAFDKVALGVSWEPQKVPYHIVCPLPDHFERSGSCYLQLHRWYCFGCHRGGDIIDFAQIYHELPDLPKAIKLVERCLDLLNTEEIEEGDLALKVALARQAKRPYSIKEWERRVSEIHDAFLDQVRPFIRCPDPLVSDRAWAIASMVFREIDLAERHAPSSPRGRREKLRRLRQYAEGWARGMAKDALRLTGKDSLDCALQAGCFPRWVPSQAWVEHRARVGLSEGC